MSSKTLHPSRCAARVFLALAVSHLAVRISFVNSIRLRWPHPQGENPGGSPLPSGSLWGWPNRHPPPRNDGIIAPWPTMWFTSRKRRRSATSPMSWRGCAPVRVVIDKGKFPVAVIHAPAPPRRTISECIALLPKDSTAVMDADFARDVEAAIESHREPLEPPAWD